MTWRSTAVHWREEDIEAKTDKERSDEEAGGRVDYCVRFSEKMKKQKGIYMLGPDAAVDFRRL